MEHGDAHEIMRFYIFEDDIGRDNFVKRLGIVLSDESIEGGPCAGFRSVIRIYLQRPQPDNEIKEKRLA